MHLWTKNEETGTAFGGMRPPRRRILNAVVAGAVVLASLAAPASAFAKRLGADQVGGTPLYAGKIRPASAPDVDAAAGILVTGDGQVLWSRNGTTPRAMASTTKLMTVLLSLEQGNLDKRVYISRAASQVPYGIGLRAGTFLTKRQLLQLALVASSNDAAFALGEDAGPGMPAFVRKMNARAAELGMTHSRFVNPHGLDAPGHYSSPADLAKLLKANLRHLTFRRYIALKQTSAPGVGMLSATDKLLGLYSGFEGGKTGTTSGAGACFVGASKRNGVALVAVVLGSGGDRFAQTARLFDWGFKHTGVRVIARDRAGVGNAVVGGVKVPLRQTGSAKAVHFDLGAPVRTSLELTKGVTRPVFKGQRLGTVVYRRNDRVLARIPAVSDVALTTVEETVGAVPVSDYLDRKVTVRSLAGTSVPVYDPAAPLTRRVALRPEVQAPVTKGQRLGEVQYSQKGRLVMTVPVVAAEDVARPGALASFRISLLRGWRALFWSVSSGPGV